MHCTTLLVFVLASVCGAQDAPANPLAGKRFVSLEKLTRGETNKGKIILDYWHIDFKDKTYQWHYTDVVSTGNYVFDAKTGVLTLGNGAGRIQASFDAKTGVLTWGNRKYKAAESAVLSVGKDGVKQSGKLTTETKNVPYAVRMEEGKTYEIRLSSKDFDAYLFVKDTKGKQLDYDDDSGGGTDSFLEFRAPTTGVYQIIATSLGMGGSGAFEFSVREKR